MISNRFYSREEILDLGIKEVEKMFLYQKRHVSTVVQT